MEMSQNKQDFLRLACGAEAFTALHFGLQNAIRVAAEKYQRAYPEATPWIITSAMRTLRRQAELMADMTPEQLRAMYCSGGTPQYIDDICKVYPASAEIIHQILANRTEGYISRHLYGLAADIAAENITHPQELKALLLEAGVAAILDERDMGIQCFHVAWKE